MGRRAPTGIKESSDLEPGNYLVNVEKFEETFSKEKNLLMYGLQLNVLAPPERAGRKHFNNFVIGTDDDPDAAQEATWKEKAGQLKQFGKAVGVPLEGEDLDVFTQHVMRKNLCIRIEHRPGKGEYAGRTFVNVTKWQQEGTMQPQLDPIANGAGNATTYQAQTPPQAPAPAPAPVPLNTPPPAQPAHQAAAGAVAPPVPPAPPAPGQNPFVPPMPPGNVA